MSRRENRASDNFYNRRQRINKTVGLPLRQDIKITSMAKPASVDPLSHDSIEQSSSRGGRDEKTVKHARKNTKSMEISVENIQLQWTNS